MVTAVCSLALDASAGLAAGLPHEPCPADLADGKLDQLSLLEAALFAGGLADSLQISRIGVQFEAKCRAVSSRVTASESTLDRTNAVLDVLHEQFLTGDYRTDYSELHRTFEEGHFNCVTSTVLFRCLCARFGIASHVVASKSHVLCRQTGGSGAYIETTCREWRLSAMPRAQEPLARVVSLHDLRELSDVQLVAKIYYNRGVAHLEQREFSEAVRLLEIATSLDRRDDVARENLLAALNNWALAESDAQEFASASKLIERGIALNPNYPPLRANDLYVHQQWIKHRCAREDFAGGLTVLDAVAERRPKEEALAKARAAIYCLWAQSHFARGELDAGWAIVEAAKQELAKRDLSEASHAELGVAAALAAGGEFISRGRVAAARRLLDQALARYPAHPALLQRRRDLPQVGT